jgi:hypothetical protein
MQPDFEQTRIPEPRKQIQRAVPLLKRRATSAIAAVALALVVALGVGTSSLRQSRSDHLSEREKQEMVEHFRGVVADLPSVNLADPQERAKAKAALDLPAPQAEQLLQQADTGQVKLGWVTVWDNKDEDGDVIQVSANGYSRTVPIMHRKVTIVVPYTSGGTVLITGVHDGGGGITAGVLTASGELQFPPLEEGQSITLPVK